MARPKGFKLSEEQLARMKEGRIAKKQAREVCECGYEPKSRLILTITGNEKDYEDFWVILRKFLRPQHYYQYCKRIEREIAQPLIWNNVEKIKEILEKYFILKVGETIITKKVKIKRERKSTYVMTDEHKEKLRIARDKKRKNI